MSNITDFPDAPVPTPSEIKSRTNVFVQAFRFAVLNVKMIAMVSKGHH
jgi:hypothetical protein